MPYQPYKEGDAEKLLIKYGIDYIPQRDELLVNCLFSGCDDDSSGKEHHLYINNKTGLYICFKCGAKGNMTTLKENLKKGAKCNHQHQKNCKLLSKNAIKH